MRVIDVWINCPDKNVAEAISNHLVTNRLVACANVFGNIQSCYHWKGQIETATEIPLLVKTRDTLFETVCEAVKSIHPYETPSIMGIPVEFVDQDYEAWVFEETADVRT